MLKIDRAIYCNCGACTETVKHWSSCAVHNEPAYPNDKCDCELVNMLSDNKRKDIDAALKLTKEGDRFELRTRNSLDKNIRLYAKELGIKTQIRMNGDVTTVKVVSR